MLSNMMVKAKRLELPFSPNIDTMA